MPAQPGSSSVRPGSTLSSCAPPPLAGVLFDLFGTLVSFGPKVSLERDAVSREMGRDLGVDPTAFAAAIHDSFDARVRGLMGSLEETVRVLAEALGGAPDRQSVARAVERRLALTRAQLAVDGETLEVLDRLRMAGLRVALVSDCSIEAPTVLATTALGARFDALAFSCTLGVRKPDPAIYLQALLQLGLAPAECVFVGDGGSCELSGATALGMHAIRLRRSGDDPTTRYDDDTEFCGAEVGSLIELLEEPRVAARLRSAGAPDA